MGAEAFRPLPEFETGFFMATSSDLHSNSTDPNRQSRDRDLFDSMATAYCRKDLLPASRRARQHRLAQTVHWVPLANTSRVLDVGCGAGFTATYLQGRYGTYVGIDQSGKLIELARTYNSLPGVTIQATPVEAGAQLRAEF